MTSKYPNDVHFPMTGEEFNRVESKVFQLSTDGKEEEADRLRDTIPVNVCIAEIMKRDLGLEFLAEHRINLWPAIEKFGEEWLEQ